MVMVACLLYTSGDEPDVVAADGEKQAVRAGVLIDIACDTFRSVEGGVFGMADESGDADDASDRDGG